VTRRDFAFKSLLIAATAAGLTAQLIRVTSNVTYFPGPFVDWATYVNGVGRLLTGDGIYASAQLAGPYRLTDVLLVGYAYPPASVPLFVPFQGYPLGIAAWITLNLGLLFTGFWRMVSRTWPHRRVTAMCLCLIGLTAFVPFLGGFIALNFNLGLAGLVAWISTGVDWRFAGLAGGLSGVIKVFPAVLALAVPKEKTKSVGLAVGIAAAIALITLPVVGVASWSEFVRALTGATPDCSTSNYSIACVVGPTIGMAAGSIIGIVVGGIAALAMCVVRRPYWLAVLSAVGIMAPANNLHLHYWTIAYVLLIATLAEVTLLQRNRVDTITAASPVQN
jgi:hypothetical protein